MEKQLSSDEDLIASAKRSAYKMDCTSVIVATGVGTGRPDGRNYYLCDMGKKPHDVHENQYDKWWIDEGSGQWHFEGTSLTNPNFAGANP